VSRPVLGRATPPTAAPLTLDTFRLRLNLPDPPPAGRADIAPGLFEAAVAIVEKYAAGAPTAVKAEAVVRIAGWVKTAVPGDLVPVSAGEIQLQWRPTVGRNALRQSGAMGLLSPWHRPAAVTIEAAD